MTEALLRLVLLVALVVNPILLARLTLRRASWVLTLAGVGPWAIALNLLVPLGLHLAGQPIVQGSLAAVHGALAVVLLIATSAGPQPAPFWPPAARPAWRAVGPLFLLYAVLVLPVTPIAGIDTYKWQDLASNVAVERAIPWLVHPASLLGFTPRAYPLAQPLVLASIQILGQTGVDWGFYLVSLLVGFTAITGAYALGRRLVDTGDHAWWLAFLYGFAPLLMRYGYWATGRGFVLALLPLFICLLVEARALPLLGAGLLAALLALSHKAGLVAALALPLAVAASPLLAPVRSRRAVQIVLLVAAGAAGLLLAPGPAAWAIRAVSRFAWLMPLAVLGWVATDWAETRGRRAVLAATLLTIPLLAADEPYGALLAAPFVAAAAAAGVAVLAHRGPLAHRAYLRPCLMGLVLLAAAVVLVRQASDSPSRAVWRAARFLDAHDPLGPFRIEAPGRVRTQMQAYVAGCPRFNVNVPPDAGLTVHRPPPLTGDRRTDLRQWTRWFRTALEVADTETAWYGGATNVYYVVVNAQGDAPPDARPIYSRDGVTILAKP